MILTSMRTAKGEHVPKERETQGCATVGFDSTFWEK